MENIEKIVDGKSDWLRLSITRRLTGVEVWIKTDPRVEDFMKSLGSTPGESDLLSVFGKNWYNPVIPLRLYRNDKDIFSGITEYSLSAPCLPLVDGRRGAINLTFLQLVGSSSPEGIRMIIEGPMGKDYARLLKSKILDGATSLLKQYITPINISLRIISNE